MPFRSYAQIAYLKHNHPEIYARWKAEGYSEEGLPQRVEKSSSQHWKKKRKK
jgi:hypothetical protein